MLGCQPIHLLGMYPGSLGITDRARDILQHAQVIAGGKRLLAALGRCCTGEAPIRPEKFIPIGRDLAEGLRRIEHAARSQRVVVLADGDPLFYGFGQRIIEALGAENVVILPNLTTLQVAAARLKLPWQSICTVSLHGRSDAHPLFAAIARHDTVAVYTDAQNTPAVIAQALLQRGAEEFTLTVCEDLDTPQERIRTLALEAVWDETFSPLNLVLLRRSFLPETPLQLGIPDHFYFHENALITKQAPRAVGLSMLGILPDSTVWDIGAGCGSIAIEASHLAWQGRVVAVEANRRRVGMIRENIRRFGAWLVDVLHAEAPACLAGLPDPDRVFIGGGLGGREDSAHAILETVCGRLPHGGRLVAHCILLETLHRAKQYLEAQRWNYGVTQLSAATSDKLAGDLRFKAQNPVFILWAEKP